MKSITVCMGSSCFSRGNNTNAEVVQDFLEKHNLLDEVEICGCLCKNECKNGPNIMINSKPFSQVAPESLYDLLSQELGLAI